MQFKHLCRSMIAMLFAFSCASAAQMSAADLRLWYTQPAEHWEDALPIGSGHLGAMVFGRTADERIQFNEDTLWTGKPHNYDRAGAAQSLDKIRQLVFAGDAKGAAALAKQTFLSDPIRQKAYQPFGDIHLIFPGHEHPTDYRRELDLQTAVARLSYRVDGVTFQRQIFASYPDNVIVVRLTADQPGKLTFAVQMDTPHETGRTQAQSPDTLITSGQVEDKTAANELGMQFESRLRAIPTGGTLSVNTGGIHITSADAVTLLLVAATDFNNFQDITADPAERCRILLSRLANKTFDDLLSTHVADHQALFDRVTLDLGRTPNADLPTDQRLRRVNAGAGPSANSKDAPSPDSLADSGLNSDPALAALFFQFGRYMLISSSRPGSQPANLQGVWNELLNPPWESKYTTNINVEMNYWPAETTNLSECHLPLFDMIHDLTISGARTASDQYRARGWVLHHNTDLWRGTAPINGIDGIWPTGGAWLCQHLWDHYLFTGDKKFLANIAYPAMRGASLFFVDYLVKDPNTGFLVSNPSFSPEQGNLCAGPALDMQLIRALFDHTIESTKLLGIDADFANQLTETRAQLAPDKIGKYGQLQEWQQDVDVPNNNHRHMSPLWGLYPGDEFTPQNPKIFAAAKLLLQWRGDGSTGWSYAWRIPLWARVDNGNAAYRQLYLQMARRTFPDLFDKCGPFQVDGNFGAAAGIAEMLLQSQVRVSADPLNRQIELLPALPSAWPTGSVSGLCARGGFEVDIAWSAGKLTHATIRSKLGEPCKIQYGNLQVALSTSPGKSYDFDGQLHQSPER